MSAKQVTIQLEQSPTSRHLFTFMASTAQGAIYASPAYHGEAAAEREAKQLAQMIQRLDHTIEVTILAAELV